MSRSERVRYHVGFFATVRAFVMTWWMITWRFVIASMVFGFNDNAVGFAATALVVLAAPIISAVMIFGFGIELHTWPIKRLLTRDSVIDHLRWYGNKYTRPTLDVNGRVTRPTGATSRSPKQRRYKLGRIEDNYSTAPAFTKIDSASKPGTTTGYEPRTLSSVTVPAGPPIYGTPGSGLGESNFGANAVRLGTAGELNFAKALHKAGLLTNVMTFWSMYMPDEHGIGADKEVYTNVDIDCVLVAGKTIFLLDMKNYRQGDVEYRTYEDGVYCIDRATGSQVGEKYKMTRNMANARTRVEMFLDNNGASRWAQYDVTAMVVLMPTDRGSGRTAAGARYPGRVELVTLTEAISAIKRAGTYADLPEHAQLGSLLHRLLKGNNPPYQVPPRLTAAAPTTPAAAVPSSGYPTPSVSVSSGTGSSLWGEDPTAGTGTSTDTLPTPAPAPAVADQPVEPAQVSSGVTGSSASGALLPIEEEAAAVAALIVARCSTDGATPDPDTVALVATPRTRRLMVRVRSTEAKLYDIDAGTAMDQLWEACAPRPVTSPPNPLSRPGSAADSDTDEVDMAPDKESSAAALRYVTAALHART